MQRKISIEEEECDSSSEENQKKMKMKDSFLGVSLKIVVFLCFLLCQVLLWLILCSEKPTGDNHFAPACSLHLFFPPSFFIVSLEVGLCGEEWQADQSSCLHTGTWLSSQMASGSRDTHTWRTELALKLHSNNLHCFVFVSFSSTFPWGSRGCYLLSLLSLSRGCNNELVHASIIPNRALSLCQHHTWFIIMPF